MAIELVCSCGQVLRFDEPPPGGQARCPECNKVVTIEDDRSILATLTDPAPDPAPALPAATRKPLWQIMARDQEGLATPQPPGGENAKETIAYDTEPAPPGAETFGPSSGRKGLWSLMQPPAAGGATPGVEPAPTGPIHFESVTTPDLGDADVTSETNPEAGTDSMRIGPPGSPELSAKSQIPDPKSEIPALPSPASNSDAPSPSLAAMFGVAANEALMSAQSKAAGFEADNSRRAVAAAVLGGLSIPLSGLALINAAWSRLPATALGFVAILTGLIASQEIERSAGRKTGRRLAITGIVTGIVGAFLGPLVIAPFGRPRKDR